MIDLVSGMLIGLVAGFMVGNGLARRYWIRHSDYVGGLWKRTCISLWTQAYPTVPCRVTLTVAEEKALEYYKV